MTDMMQEFNPPTTDELFTMTVSSNNTVRILKGLVRGQVIIVQENCFQEVVQNAPGLCSVREIPFEQGPPLD